MERQHAMSCTIARPDFRHQQGQTITHTRPTCETVLQLSRIVYTLAYNSIERERGDDDAHVL